MYLAYVYFVRCKNTNQFYYGSRASNIRFKRHPEEDFWIHYFTSSKKIKELIDMYGKEAFEFEILLKHSDYKVCFWKEQQLIKDSKTNPLRLNRRYTDPDTGRNHLTTYGESPESKEARIKKMQKTKKGKFNSNGHLGLKASDKQRENMRKAQQALGYKHSEELKKEMGQAQKEKAMLMTAEERKKRYGGCKGKPWSDARRLAELTKKRKIK